MFSLLWRFLPGPPWFRISVMSMVFVALVFVMLFYGYPYMATLIEGGSEESVVGVGS